MILSISHLTKSFQQPDGTSTSILNIDSFQMEAGEQTALVGESGGGKTTLLNVIAGITKADSGKVEIQGVDTTKLPEVGRDRFRAEYIGFVYQTFNLLPGFSALENVMLGMSFGGQKADRHFAKDLLNRVGLTDRLQHKPRQLSVGQQQRVAVARALANRPALLLADEPTANVDRSNRDAILELIQETVRENNVSLLLVTHSEDVASRFPRVEELSSFNQIS